MHPTRFTSLLTIALAAFTGLSGVADGTPVPAPWRPPHSKSTPKHTNTPTINAPQSIKDLPGLPDSKKKPQLISGNFVVTPDPTIVVNSLTPSVGIPKDEADKERLGLDILRGMVHHGFSDGKEAIQSTFFVLDVPNAAKGQRCAFHFVTGSGDFVSPEEVLEVWYLIDKPVEFKTTFNNKPGRDHVLTKIFPYKGQKISQTPGDSQDARFEFPHGSRLIQDKKHEGEMATFLCDPFVGKHGYEIILRPTKFDDKGRPASVSGAWSMNKGFMIEVIGVPEPKRTHQGKDDKDDADVQWDDDEDY